MRAAPRISCSRIKDIITIARLKGLTPFPDQSTYVNATDCKSEDSVKTDLRKRQNYTNIFNGADGIHDQLEAVMKLRSQLRLSTALPLAATALMAGINVASATETFTYSGYTVTNEQTIDITKPNAINGGMGQIVLSGTYSGSTGYTGPKPNPILAWCLDVYVYLQNSATYTLSGPLTSSFSEAGFGTASATQTGSLSSTQIGEIGALITEGDSLISSTPGTNNISAAIQIAIWSIEYSNFAYSGVSSATTALANTYIHDVTADIWSPDPNVYLLTGSNNQTLAFDTDGPPIINNGGATPAPAALPLFATGLGVMGLFGWRRKRKSVASIAA